MNPAKHSAPKKAALVCGLSLLSGCIRTDFSDEQWTKVKSAIDFQSEFGNSMLTSMEQASNDESMSAFDTDELKSHLETIRSEMKGLTRDENVIGYREDDVTKEKLKNATAFYRNGDIYVNLDALDADLPFDPSVIPHELAHRWGIHEQEVNEAQDDSSGDMTDGLIEATLDESDEAWLYSQLGSVGDSVFQATLADIKQVDYFLEEGGYTPLQSCRYVESKISENPSNWIDYRTKGYLEYGPSSVADIYGLSSQEISQAIKDNNLMDWRNARLNERKAEIESEYQTEIAEELAAEATTESRAETSGSLPEERPETDEKNAGRSRPW